MENDSKYIDIHTHTLRMSGELQIYNQPITMSETIDSFHSIGIHPWNISNQDETDSLLKIKNKLQQQNVLAIGECGLDKLIHVDFEKQKKIFKEQIKLAEEFQKPLIIHCVKAFDDLMRIKKEMKISVPMIIHGYNNNMEIAEQLVKSGFYFSFGKSLNMLHSNASKVITMIPTEKLFLETDDAAETIESIYQKAEQRLQLKTEELKRIIYNNFTRVFLNPSHKKE